MNRITGMSIVRRGRQRSGFTLIEAMVSSVIMLMVLGSVLGLAASGFRYIRDMRASARSSQVLQQKMEDIRLITVWTNLWALNNTTFVDNAVTGVVYNGRINIGSTGNTYPTSYLACVTLTVSWTNSLKKVRTNRLSGYVCQNGLNKYIF